MEIGNRETGTSHFLRPGGTENKEQRPIRGQSDDDPSRIGQIVNVKSVWDNGLYATDVIEGVAVDFLVDSGSTATLLSKESFDKLGGEHTIGLHQRSIVMQGVDGKKHERVWLCQYQYFI